MTRGKQIEEKIRQYFKTAREKMPEITDEMLCNENGEYIYYMNGNDGTDFDWIANGNCCEFFMFFKSTEMGFIKVYVNNDDTISGYMYKENYKWGDDAIYLDKGYLSEGDSLYLAALLYMMADRKRIYDKAINQIDFEYNPSEYEMADINGEKESEDDDDIWDAEWFDDDDDDDELFDD